MNNDYQFQLAAKQRYHALENAFNTIRQFAVPSYSPDMFEKFESVEKYLLEMYRKDVNWDQWKE